MANDAQHLRAKTRSVAGLDAGTREAMWHVFANYYDGVSREAFERDLAGKDHVIVLRDRRDASVQGFSTLASFVREVEGRVVVGLFSGDTIVARAYWSQTALQRAFLAYAMRLKLRHPFSPVYWFLISKGFRTYLLLARNFPEYWPRHDRPTAAWQAAVIDDFARQRFGDAWSAARGTLVFSECAGKLKHDAAPIDARAAALPEVQFFLARNPGHARGDELCCLGRIDGRLWLFYMRKLLRRCLTGRKAPRPAPADDSRASA